MKRWVAFLRGMNLGRRRISNPELCAAFAELGLSAPTAFLASGNVVFDAHRATGERLAARIEAGLERSLGYAVPTFVRAADEVRAIAAHAPFPPGVVARSGGKLQVALLPTKPAAAARRAVLAHASDEDRLDLVGRELYWLPEGGILDSALDLAALEAAIGPWTLRTRRTVERIAAKLLAE
jgi:uncharacterized protein (DUF1697 family)